MPKQDGISEDMGESEAPTEKTPSILDDLSDHKKSLGRERNQLKTDVGFAKEMLASYEEILNGDTQEEKAKGE